MKYGKDFWVIDPVTFERLPLTQPKLHPFAYPDNGSRGFWLLEDFAVEFIFRGMRWRLIVKGWPVADPEHPRFDFDGASIPQAVWSVIGDPIALDILIPATFHDIFFCAHLSAWPLALTNALFLEMQQACRAAHKKTKAGQAVSWLRSWGKRNTTTLFVRACGWALWKKSDEDMAKYRALIVATPSLA